MLAVVVVALYLRISKDPFQLKAGVTRQRKDCRALAALRWPDATIVEYADNDVSASRFSRKARVEFTCLCADMESGRVDAVIGWDFDRMFRQPRELEAFLDLCTRLNFTRVVTAQGDVDLTSNDGRLHARILTAVAAKESDDKSRRIRRANLDRREQGLHHGGRVVYGYTLDRRVPQLDVPAAELVGEAARRVLAGQTLQSTARWLRTADPAAPSTGAGVKKMLLSPTLVGRTTGGTRGDWAPILSDNTYAELCAMLLDPRRATNAPSGKRRWWLSGLVHCGRCGCKMVIRHESQGRNHSYACNTVDSQGCGRMAIRALGLHRQIEIAILHRATFLPPVPPAPFPVTPDEDRLSELAGLYATGVITRSEWMAARSSVTGTAGLSSSDESRVATRVPAVEGSTGAEADQGEVPRTVDRAGCAQGGRGGPEAPRWGPGVDERHRRAQELIVAVHIHPRVVGGPRWQPTRVNVEWRHLA